MVHQVLFAKGIAIRGSYLDSLLKHGNLLECTTIFESNIGIFLSNIPFIRSKLKMTAFTRIFCLHFASRA